VKPRATRLDFAANRALVHAPLAARLPLEVFYCVRHVGAGSIDSGRSEAVVEHPTGGAHERSPRDVLFVAGLLADDE
jgi:hypothetical protein